MKLERCQRRLNGKKQNYYVDLDTGIEYLKKPTRKINANRTIASTLPSKEYQKVIKAASEKKRYLRRSKQLSEWDDLVFSQAYELAVERTNSTGITWEVDHMLPLLGKRVSGLHNGFNIQVIPALLNRMKGRKEVYTETAEWVNELKA